MTPRSQALAFLIWRYCEPIGWDCNIKDVADALGVSWQAIRGVCTVKGWNTRFRKDLALPGVNWGEMNTSVAGRNAIAEYVPQELEE